MKCNPNYKNLNEIQSFSDQSYATVQWANQNCENDEYLKQKTDELSYRVPPYVRKRFSPILLDDLQSWGCQVNQDNTVTFSSKDKEEFLIDFTDFDLIDENKTDCSFENIITHKTYVDEKGETQLIPTNGKKKAVVPMVENSTVNYNCRNFTEGKSINSYWYVGYDKAKAYQVRPDWIKDYFDREIPSIVRAQTITIPESADGGYLESVDLQIENNGTTNSNWGSPLIVQVWKTVAKKVEKTKWNTKKRKAESYSPKQYETIYWPSGNPKTPLAQSVYYPTKTNPHFQNFLFDTPVKVSAGEHYALVIFSPLSHYDHCPRIGGWGRNCAIDKYAYGDAFLSENNGRTFIRYGRNDLNVKYKMGRITPMDFAFQCHIRKYSSGRIANEEFFLYLKPIHTNPVKKVEISATGSGDELSEEDILRFEVSQNGKTWRSLNNNYTLDMIPDSKGEYPQVIFIRAVLKAASTSVTNSPYLEKFKVTLDLDMPKEFYARTHFYYPKVSPMLGANVWGRIYAPFTLEPTVTGGVEIIRDKLVTEHFQIITLNELSDENMIGDDGLLQPILSDLEVESLTDEDLTYRCKYLAENTWIIDYLKDQNVYIKPYSYHDITDDVDVYEPLSFTRGLEFTNSPACPIQEAILQPDGNNDVVAYSEWLDYTFDYDNDRLEFYNEENNQVIDGLPVGTLAVSYNPVFIQDLTNEEVGVRENDEGLILDYFKENIIISDTMLNTGNIPLRVQAVDPLRSVTLNDKELREDVDFTMDYINNQLVFELDSITGKVLSLNVNDILEVVYTPNLDDVGVSIGYRAKRENTSKNMIIPPNYIEYKV